MLRHRDSAAFLADGQLPGLDKTGKKQLIPLVEVTHEELPEGADPFSAEMVGVADHDFLARKHGVHYRDGWPHFLERELIEVFDVEQMGVISGIKPRVFHPVVTDMNVVFQSRPPLLRAVQGLPNTDFSWLNFQKIPINP